MGKIRVFILLALLAGVVWSCKEKDVKPNPLLTEAQMIDVLTDTYLMEAELNQRRARGENIQSLQSSYFPQIFEHYGITDTIFDQNMTYYTQHPEVLERIMDSVNQRFETMKRHYTGLP